MKRFLLILAAACAAPSREAKQEPPPAPAVKEAPRPAAIADEDVLVEDRPQAEGKTLLEVVSPQGTRVDVHEGQALVGRDAAPMTVRAEGDHWYTIAARLPSGEARETKVQARAGQIASVRFAQSAPSGPQAMSRDEFKKFVHAVDEEAGDAAKLALIK